MYTLIMWFLSCMCAPSIITRKKSTYIAKDSHKTLHLSIILQTVPSSTKLWEDLSMHDIWYLHLAESEVNRLPDYGRTHGHAVSSLAPIVNKDISNAEAKKKKRGK